MFRLDGKIAAVTGAGSGIGRAIANTFANAGARVFVLERDTRAGEETAAGIRAKGGLSTAIDCDVAAAESVDAAFVRSIGKHPASISSLTMPASRISAPLKTPAKRISIVSTRLTSRVCFSAPGPRCRG